MREERMPTYSGNIIDLIAGTIYPGTVLVRDGRIVNISRETTLYSRYIMPGFVDAHIHVESSMLPPSEFARACVVHGTVAVVSDPHEIANVLGLEGVHFMLNSAAKVPVKFYFSAPSCVPATAFETSGAQLDASQLEVLLQMDQIKYLGEMMNYPGVIFGTADVMEKLALARKYQKPIDGHSPGLSGTDLKKYVAAGISTDHECFTTTEALEKISLGMKILIREGSAARNLEELLPVAREYPEQCMFCSDDKHPDDLKKGHINLMVKRALNAGMDLLTVLKMATLNPVKHYGLDVGLLQVGEAADFLLVEDLETLEITETIIDGVTVARKGMPTIAKISEKLPNQFNTAEKILEAFAVAVPANSKIRVIEVKDGQLYTQASVASPLVSKGNAIADPARDILKLAVVNRYQDNPPAVGFVKNFGLKSGAIASSVAHDSHNIVAVGVNDTDLCDAVNLVIRSSGGIALADRQYGLEEVLPLPIAGLMSDLPFDETAARYTKLDQLAKSLGTPLRSPFMTLSFMALLVIPELKLSDRGLFDAVNFKYVDLVLS